ncbi:hypothetical protein AKJ58_00990 [candidate division MSBL1 archaeon SCGC-AAA385D11]|uniref:Type II methyltransferase n=1 Tax=candidate division MSBL1 archaeon SCGC-AAA385D11 TaxID=1698286 RepID=A0A133VNQ5_9EURY|nr:hypothetical protein AKJ58_00990 [candidate division MSBL1 archaeon SCGC-AAA385D11]
MATVSGDWIKKLPLDSQIEIYENIVRKDYTQVELAKIQSELKDEFSKHTEQGRRTDLEDGTSAKNFAEVKRVSDMVGGIFGESGRTVEKRVSVYKQAKENPDDYGDLLERMEESVHSAHRELKRRKDIAEREEKLKDAPELKNLILGDCLEKIEEIPDDSIHLLLTDPPYGTNTVTGARFETEKLREDWTYDGDDESVYPLLNRLFEKMKPKLVKDAHIYIFTSWKAWHRLYPIVDEFFEVKNWLVYLHYMATAGDLYRYRTAASSIMFASNGGKRPIGSHKWNFIDERGTYRKDGMAHHPAQKSISICKKLIENSTVEGETVLDPFCGSGSTLVAAEELGRNWIGIEKERRWYDVAKSRILEARN